MMVLKSTAIGGIGENKVKVTESFHYAESTCPHCDLAAADSTYVHGESLQPPRAKAISPCVSTAERCSLRQRNPLAQRYSRLSARKPNSIPQQWPRTATVQRSRGPSSFSAGHEYPSYSQSWIFSQEI